MRGKAIAIHERAYWMARREAGESLSALSVESGIRREVLSRWWQRYQADGLSGFEPRSRRPKRSPTAVRRSVVRAVLQQRQKARGPAVIATAVPVSVSTVYRFNKTNFALPNRNVSDATTIGTITSLAGDPRIMQLAFRFAF